MSEEKEAYEFQPEVDRLVRHLVRKFRPFIVGLQDLDGFCRQIVADMLAERWRPPLHQPPPWRDLHDQRPANPADNPEWRAAKAKITGKDQP